MEDWDSALTQEYKSVPGLSVEIECETPSWAIVTLNGHSHGEENWFCFELNGKRDLYPANPENKELNYFYYAHSNKSNSDGFPCNFT